MPTLKDVSQHVGVSVSTVSRVINNDTSRHINADTKAKVWQAVQELGYEPNESARRLVKNQKEEVRPTKQIGCIVAGSHLREDHPYFSPILAGFNKKLIELGYTVAFIHTPEEIGDEVLLRKMVQEIRIDGVIVIGWINEKLLNYLKSTRIAIVGISASGHGISLVDYDRVSAAKTAVDHLLAQGHRKIGFVGGHGHTGELDSEERFQGYKYALFEAGITLNPSWIINTNWKVDKSFEDMTGLIEHNGSDLPTAMLSASDLLAIPAMRAVLEHHLRIPEDIAFIAMDNIELSQYTSPPLSSVHVPKYEIGMVAAKTLVDELQGGYPLTSKILLPFEMRVRQSSNYNRK
ncbi:LacI family transcriptional regulator [Paenibacillus alkaliterrae]|uniref:LacI family DNA-binding transcriptional regulator n=1 Tax=Paenibacillus alkaliterrae TaxID=320909 RepID=UPI001F3F07A6|nr:LacI family DNA-binding transcriptional regulator [Paenibacillus alkaliterrae]MCF2938659.1 LacI family transcriptional regulator [Paenibacillus alkaliterrae]